MPSDNTRVEDETQPVDGTRPRPTPDDVERAVEDLPAGRETPGSDERAQQWDETKEALLKHVRDANHPKVPAP